MAMMKTLVVLACAGFVSAWAPARVTLRRTSLRVSMETEAEVASASEASPTADAVVPLAEQLNPVAEVKTEAAPAPAMETTSAASSEPSPTPPNGVMKFKARDRELWAKDAGYGKFADQETSFAYLKLVALMEESSALKPLLGALKPYIEMTRERPALLDGTHAGDYGFDPMNYANTEELLYFYMESEVKHGRLAMLASAGWIAAELSTGEKAPSLLNGHLFDLPNLAAVVMTFGLWSWLEHIQYPAQYLEHTPNSGRYNYQHYEDGPYAAGNYEFDPLNLYNVLGNDAAGRKAMRSIEINHGRFAMVGLTSWVLFEAITRVPATSAFACFFKPFWAWGLPFMGENGIIGTVEFAALLGLIGSQIYATVSQFDSLKYQGDENV